MGRAQGLRSPSSAQKVVLLQYRGPVSCLRPPPSRTLPLCPLAAASFHPTTTTNQGTTKPAKPSVPRLVASNAAAKDAVAAHTNKPAVTTACRPPPPLVLPRSLPPLLPPSTPSPSLLLWVTLVSLLLLSEKSPSPSGAGWGEGGPKELYPGPPPVPLLLLVRRRPSAGRPSPTMYPPVSLWRGVARPPLCCTGRDAIHRCYLRRVGSRACLCGPSSFLPSHAETRAMALARIRPEKTLRRAGR